MTKIFKKAKKYTSRIMDAMEILQLFTGSTRFSHKSYNYSKEHDNRLYIKVKHNGRLFYEEIISYYPENIQLKSTTDAIKIHEHVNLTDISTEYEFQLQTVYTDEEILDMYIGTLLSYCGFNGHIFYDKNVPLGTITKIKSNLQDYIDSRYSGRMQHAIRNMRFKSEQLK